MSHATELPHSTFGMATLLVQPPRPDKTCYRCQQDAWRPGSGCWVCDVCHPIEPVMQRYSRRPERVYAWQGEVPQRMRKALAAGPPPFKS